MSNATNIRLLVADDSDETRTSILKLLSLEDDIEVVGQACNGREAVEKARELRPHVVLMDVRMPEMDGFTATEALVAEVSSAQVILMSVAGTADFLRRAMLAGAREFLVKPFEPEELVASVRRVYEFHPGEEIEPVLPPPVDTPSTPLPTTEGQVIAVFGPKGGVGRTTVACNLACALAAKGSSRVALVDGCLRFGDIGMMLSVPNDRGVADLATIDPGEIDLQMIEGALLAHKSGVRVLLAPPTPEQGDLVSEQCLRRVVSELRRAYDFVVVDVSPGMEETDLAMLDLADRVVTVFSLEMTALKNMKLFLDLAKSLNVGNSKLLMVANRVDDEGGVRLADVEGSLHFTTAVCLRNDPRTATLAMNKGMPFVISQSHTGLAQGVQEIATLVATKAQAGQQVDAAAQKGKKGGRLPFFSGKGKSKEAVA